jgi:hypothetical protein
MVDAGSVTTKNPRQLSGCTRVARWCSKAIPAWASQQPTRRPITTSISRLSITHDGSLRTGQTSNPSGERTSRAVSTPSDDAGCAQPEIGAPPACGGESGGWTGCHDAQVVTGSSDTAPTPPLVINISPMAHFAVGFFALGLLIPVFTWPATAPLLVIPVILSAFIIRLRTQADREGVTVRTLLGSQTVRWEEIDGLRFNRGSWARAQLKNGGVLRLPAVTFATLPLLTEASGGRVPNPYG